MRQAFPRVGVALGQHGERLVEFGIDADGAQERLVGLFVVGFQAGVLDVAARAGGAGLHGDGEIAARLVIAMFAQGQHAEALLGLRDLQMVVEQAPVFAAARQVRSRLYRRYRSRALRRDVFVAADDVADRARGEALKTLGRGDVLGVAAVAQEL